MDICAVGNSHWTFIDHQSFRGHKSISYLISDSDKFANIEGESQLIVPNSILWIFFLLNSVYPQTILIKMMSFFFLSSLCLVFPIFLFPSLPLSLSLSSFSSLSFLCIWLSLSLLKTREKWYNWNRVFVMEETFTHLEDSVKKQQSWQQQQAECFVSWPFENFFTHEVSVAWLWQTEIWSYA